MGNMKSMSIWIFLAIIVLIIGLIFYCIQTNVKSPKSIDNSVVYSLITALTAIITVIGSIYVNQSLASENAKNQRSMEIRKMKQDYYHRFTESFMLRLAYLPNQNSNEFKDADKKFCIEKNRLPLYASQEIVEYVDEVASGKNLTANFKTLFELIREDLKNDDFRGFEELKDISVTLPAESTRKGSQ
jgi:heme/copper-type cytochrome/quinol oxidase subunit 2